jgi:hypothetical protein
VKSREIVMGWKHLAACVVVVAAGLTLAVAGVESLGVLVAIACPLMMGAMVWMMVRGRARGH